MSQTMLYKCLGPHEIHGGRFDYTIVDDDKIEQAIAEGWSLSTPEAKAAHEAAKAAVVPEPPVSDAPATRAELEQKATELQIKFDGRTSDKKLGEQIASALKV